jgi:mycothiol synthase
MLNACEAHDQLDENTSVDELRDEFSTPGFDPEHNLRLWQDDDGRLLGFGQLWFHAEAEDPDGFVWYKVHPDARGHELDAQILEWAEARVRTTNQERGTQLKLRAVAHDSEPERIAVLQRAGFEADRYFWRMACPLDGPLAAPLLPEGFMLAAGPHDPEAWAALFNESFVDHWNHVPKTADEVRHYQQEKLYRPDLDLVALAPDGTPAAFCWGSISSEQGGLNGQIGLLGTRRGFRKLGLGRAMLLAGMHALRAAGATSARLGVDAASPTGATHLYEAVGFRPTLKRALYGKDL